MIDCGGWHLNRRIAHPAFIVHIGFRAVLPRKIYRCADRYGAERNDARCVFLFVADSHINGFRDTHSLLGDDGRCNACLRICFRIDKKTVKVYGHAVRIVLFLLVGCFIDLHPHLLKVPICGTRLPADQIV